MAPQIGTFLTKFGTEGRDIAYDIKSGVLYFGYGGDDIFWPITTGYLWLNGVPYSIPAIINGGDGNDTYRISPTGNIVISDDSTSNKDILSLTELYANEVETLFSIDGRHLFVQAGEDRYGLPTTVLILDALNSKGAIESIQFKDIEFSGEAQSISRLISTYKTADNQSLNEFLASGYLNPKVMGIDLTEVDSIINKLTTPVNQAIPTYTLTPSATSINEGSTLTTSIATANVASGSTIYWSIVGTGINTSDFSSGGLIGTGTLGADGRFSIAHTAANDLATEGNEALQVKLFSDSARAIEVASSASVALNDTSISYPLSLIARTGNSQLSTTTVSENLGIISFVTSDLPPYNQQKYYWLLSGEGVTKDDFLNSGTFTSSIAFSGIVTRGGLISQPGPLGLAF